jgi:hypothetical protein
MAAQAHHKLVGTADTECRLMVDTLVIPFASPTAIGTVVGSLLAWIVSATISGTTVTLQMKEDFNFRPGSVFLPKGTVEGAAAKWDVALASWDATTKRFTFNTYNAAGVLTAPVAGVTMHLLAIMRY